MAQVFHVADVLNGGRPMTDDEILAGLQKMIRRADSWPEGTAGGNDGPDSDRVEHLLDRARAALALSRTSDLIIAGLPLAPCPTCAMYPDAITGWIADELDATFATGGFRRTVRGLINSITLDCGHTLGGDNRDNRDEIPLLGQWVATAEKMRTQTAGYWKAQAETAAAERDRAKDRADELEGDNLELQEKYRRRLRKARQRNKILRAAIVRLTSEETP
jgi:hypothetical protein